MLSTQVRTIVAGGTDFYPALGDRSPAGPLMDISNISEARGISEQDDTIRIGALTTWSDLMRAALPPGFDGLKQAAATVGGVQIQNVASIAGNLCNASPAADGVPPLLTLEAEVELRSVRGTRVEPLRDFITGNRATTRANDELVTAILVPKALVQAPASATFLKLGSRSYLVISIASVAVLLHEGDGRVSKARVAVGACSAIPQRLSALERALEGQPLSAGLADAVTPEHLSPLQPITDIRATATYRLDAVSTMLRRALAMLGGRP